MMLNIDAVGDALSVHPTYPPARDKSEMKDASDADVPLGALSLPPPLAFVPSLKLLQTSRSLLTPSPNLPLNPPAGQTSPSLTQGGEDRGGWGK